MSATATGPDPLARGVAHLVSQAEFALAFGGEIHDGAARLSAYAGLQGASIRGLLIETGEGLGGRALLERHVRFTTDYSRTSWITHRYGREVGAEGIVTLLAVPIVVDRSVRALLYAGFRDAVQLGNDIARRAARVADRVAWDLSVQDEVDRRLALLRTEGRSGHSSSRHELRERYTELRDLARTVSEPVLRRRIEAIADRVAGSAPAPDAGAVVLTPRETDVLALVALGHRNGVIAGRLGLTESTVKKYLSTAMSKLGANGRFDAVLRARLAGIIP